MDALIRLCICTSKSSLDAYDIICLFVVVVFFLLIFVVVVVFFCAAAQIIMLHINFSRNNTIDSGGLPGKNSCIHLIVHL